MFLFQSLATIFILFVMIRVVARYRDARIPKSEIWVWLIFWSVIAIAIWWPRGTDILANYLGISRGYELVVAISIAILFYLMFKVFTHLHQLQYQTTKLVRKLALEKYEEPEIIEVDIQTYETN